MCLFPSLCDRLRIVLSQFWSLHGPPKQVLGTVRIFRPTRKFGYLIQHLNVLDFLLVLPPFARVGIHTNFCAASNPQHANIFIDMLYFGRLLSRGVDKYDCTLGPTVAVWQEEFVMTIVAVCASRHEIVVLSFLKLLELALQPAPFVKSNRERFLGPDPILHGKHCQEPLVHANAVFLVQYRRVS